MSKQFIKKVYIEKTKEPKVNRLGFLKKKYFIFFLLIITPLLILSYLVLSLKPFWSEIQFAIQKPSIVKHVREDYQNQQQKVDQSFLKSSKSSEQALIDEVVSKLKSDTLK